MSEIGERLKAHWLAQGVEPPPGVPEALLQQFETHYGVTLPGDMRDYFLHVNGIGGELTDDQDLFRFWPLQEVLSITDDPDYQDIQVAEGPSFFIFADHSIFLPAYAIRLDSARTGDHPAIAFWWDHHDRRHEISTVARSFSEFAERYLKGDDSRFDLAYGTAKEN
jgi:SMI1 / KNR4 family (SUKH-1)